MLILLLVLPWVGTDGYHRDSDTDTDSSPVPVLSGFHLQSPSSEVRCGGDAAAAAAGLSSQVRHFRSVMDAVDDDDNPCLQQITGSSSSAMSSVSLENLFEVSRKYDGLKKSALHIGALFDNIDNDTTEREAAELAVQHINERNILPGFTLQLVHNVSHCDPGTATDALHDIIFRQPTIIALLGPTCNNATQTLAEIVQYWHLTHLSFGATLPTLNDRNSYRTFSRVCISKEAFKMAVQRFLQSHNWSLAALLLEDSKQAILTGAALEKHLNKHQINITTQQVFKYVSPAENDISKAIHELKRADARIIVVIMDEYYIPDVFCAIYRNNLYGRRYVWILSTVRGWMHPGMMYWTDYSSEADAREYFRPIFRERLRELRCAEKEIMEALQNVFLTKPLNTIPDAEKQTSFGITLAAMKRKYAKRNKLSVNFYFAYDSVWTVAIAIARYILVDDEEVAAARRKTLVDFKYANGSELTKEIIRLIENTSFIGMSGTVRFREADRVGVNLIKQVQRNRLVLVAMHETKELTDHLELDCDGCHPIYWESNRIPIDRSLTQMFKLRIDYYAVLIVSILTICCLAVCVCLLAFNIYHRHLKFIKLSSPQLNNAAIGGCILVYCGLLLLGSEELGSGLPADGALICPIRMSLFAAGFSFSFGAIFVKTYRVFSIFKFSHLGLHRRRLLRDEHLLGVVTSLFLVDMLVIVTWQFIDPVNVEEKETYIAELAEAHTDVILIPHYSQCSSRHFAQWCGVMYAFKGAMLLFGVFMAWSTRNVKIDALNDSRYIAMNIYNVLVTSVVVLLIAELLKDRPTLWYVSISVLVLASTTSALLMLFIPKIYTVYKFGGEAPVTSEGFTIESKTRRFGSNKDIKELIHRAEVQNRVFRWKLHEMEAEAQRLEQVLREPLMAYPKISIDDIGLLPETAVDVASRHHTLINRRKSVRRLLDVCNTDASTTEEPLIPSEFDYESVSASQKSSDSNSRKQVRKKNMFTNASSMLVYNSVRQLAVPVIRVTSQQTATAELRRSTEKKSLSLRRDRMDKEPAVMQATASVVDGKLGLKIPRDLTSEFSEISCDQSTYI